MTPHCLEYGALALAVAGLLAVLGEIVAKESRMGRSVRTRPQDLTERWAGKPGRTVEVGAVSAA